jgi:hypothetical protein
MSVTQKYNGRQALKQILSKKLRIYARIGKTRIADLY